MNSLTTNIPVYTSLIRDGSFWDKCLQADLEGQRRCSFICDACCWFALWKNVSLIYTSTLHRWCSAQDQVGWNLVHTLLDQHLPGGRVLILHGTLVPLGQAKPLGQPAVCEFATCCNEFQAPLMPLCHVVLRGERYLIFISNLYHFN